MLLKRRGGEDTGSRLQVLAEQGPEFDSPHHKSPSRCHVIDFMAFSTTEGEHGRSASSGLALSSLSLSMTRRAPHPQNKRARGPFYTSHVYQ